MANVDVLMERMVPPADMEVLTRSCGEEPPEHVIRDYWDYRKIRDRNDNSHVQPHELYLLVLFSQRRANIVIHDNPAKPFPVMKQIEKGIIKYGDFLRVHWGGQERKGMFIESSQATKTLRVLIGTVERTVDAEQVLGPFVEQQQPEPVEA